MYFSCKSFIYKLYGNSIYSLKDWEVLLCHLQWQNNDTTIIRSTDKQRVSDLSRMHNEMTDLLYYLVCKFCSIALK